MADVLDSFVVSLGLDPTDYNDQIKKYRQDRKRLDEEDHKSNRVRIEGQKDLTAGIRTLRNETAGFLVMLAGANSIKDFAANLLMGDAASGRFAANIGLATQQVSAWEEAVKRAGGQSGDAQSALRTMASAFQSLQLTGTTGHDADLQGLGVSSSDLRDPEQALLKISSASERMPRAEFTARLQRLGLTDSTITLLAKGRKGLTDLLAEVRRVGVATDQSAQDAQEFDAALSQIGQTIRAEARPAIQGLAKWLADLGKNQQTTNVLFYAGVGLLGALALAAGLAYAPFIALAAAIATVAANIDKIKSGWTGFEKWWGGVQEGSDKFLDPIRTSAWGQALGMKTGAELRAERNDTPTVDPTHSPTASIGAGASRSGGGNAARAEQFFRANGFSAAQAKGMVAAMKAENGSLDPSAFNSAGGGQGAYGLGQWRGPRLRALRAKYGPNPTFDEQLQFMRDEMRGTERKAGAAIGAAGSSGDAAKTMIDAYYRPGAGAAGDYRRAGSHLGAPIVRGGRAGNTSNSTSTSIGQIVIYSAATDAKGLASDLRGQLAQRGLVVQANTGLQP